MNGARRLLLVVAVAAIAVVPLRAFGVVGGDSASGLSVDAALGGCGVSGAEIVCEIQVAFGPVEGADHYTASVTRADGSVQDAGTVGTGESGGSASIYVPYVGSGTYSVTVSAWGSGEDGGETELLERDRGGAGEDGDGGGGTAEPTDPAAETPEEVAPPEAAEAPEESSEAAATEAQTLPQCESEAVDAAAADPAAAETQAAGANAEAATAPPQAPPAPAIECTEPSSDANGPCCPPGA